MAIHSASVTLSANVQPYVQGLGQAEQATTGAMSRIQQSVTRNEQSVNKLSNTLGLVGGAAVAAEGLAVKKFADFDKAMSQVAATGADARSRIDELRDAAIKAGAATQYSATEAAEGVTELAKAGVSAADILGGGLTGALNLAAAGQMSVADAATDTSIALTQFGLKGEDASHVADLLAAGAGKAAGDVSDMAMALNQSGLVAHQTGLTIEETTGALADFASQGLIGSDAGTSFKTMLQALTPNSKQAAAAMKEIGLSAYDGQGNFVGLTTVASQLKDGLSKLTVEQQNATLKTIFGSDAVRAASILYKDGAEGVQTWIDNVNDAGYAAESAAILQDNLSGDIEQLGGSFETLQIKMGSTANGPMRAVVQGVTGIVNAIGDLPSAVTGGFGVLLGVGGAFALAVAGAGKAVIAFKNVKLALQALSISANTTKLALGAIGAVIAVATVALTTWGSSSAQTQGEVDSLTEALKAQNGVIDDNYKAIIANSIATEKLGGILGTSFGATDVSDVLDRVGISAKEATDYITGNADAVSDVDQKLKSYTETAQRGDKTVSQLNGFFDEQQKVVAKSTKQYDTYAAALDNGTTATDQNASATKKYTDAVADGTAQAQDFTAALNDVVDAQLKASGSALSARDAARNFQQSIDDATKAVEDNGKTLDIHTEKGRDNQEALDKVARAGLDVVKSAEDQGASQKQLQAKMKSARQAYIDAAEAMGLSSKKANALADSIGLIPDNVKVQVDAETAAAQRKLDALRNQISHPGNWTINANVNTANAYIAIGALQKALNIGAPASIAAPGRATGGEIYGPGGPTDDKVLIRASPGEFVVNAKSYAKYGPLVNAINSGTLPAFAKGGKVPKKWHGKSLEYWQDRYASGTAYLQLKQAISHDKASLREKEKYGKDNKLTRYVLRGIDRSVANSQLRDDRKALADANTARAFVKKYGSFASAIKKRDTAQDKKDAAASAQKDAKSAIASGRTDTIRDARRGNTEDAVTGGLDSALGVVDQLRDEASNKSLSAKQRKSLSATANQAEKDLTRLYKQADNLQGALDKAKDHLADMQQIADAASDTIKGTFDLTGANAAVQHTDAYGNSWSTSGYTKASIQAAAKTEATNAKTFAGKLSTMQKKLGTSDASAAIVQQALSIFGQDPAAGIQFVDAINSMSASELGSLKSSYNTVASAGTSAGQSASAAVSVGGLSAANTAASDLATSLADVNKQIAGIGTTVTNAMLKPYGLKLDKNGNVVKRAHGGLVGGSGGEDSVHLMADPREFMVNKRATAANLPWLQAINAGRTLTSVPGLSGASNVTVTLPEIRVQNPFTGEYLVAQVSAVADGRIAANTAAQDRQSAYVGGGL